MYHPAVSFVAVDIVSAVILTVAIVANMGIAALQPENAATGDRMLADFASARSRTQHVRQGRKR